MCDLISRAALLEFAHNHVNGTVDCNDIARFPAVDADPVRHTKCDFCGRGKPIKAYTYLRDCGLQYGTAIEAIYCPNCGTKISEGGLVDGNN